MCRRLLAPAALVLALPALMGSHCGFILDYGETRLITDPVELIVITVDDGNVDAVSFEREGILLRRHTFAFQRKLEQPSFSVEDDVLGFTAHCKDNDDDCSFDHMLELPFGIGFDITMDDAQIDMGYMDADITASFDTGYFNGVRLASPRLDVTANSAEIDADFAAVPESVVIDLDDGDVTLSLPAGQYQCLLDSTNGEVTVEGDGIVCDDAATAVLDVRLGVGDILVMEVVS
jgi:hypothetical protein